MGKIIAIVGLYSIPNMGDRILCETSAYLTKELMPSVEIKEVDVCPRFESDYKGLEYIKYRISRKLKTVGEKNFKYEDGSSFRYHYEYFMWHLRLNRYYKKSFTGVDAILFAGGGFLKFRTQGLNYYVEMILKIAKKNRIPVMMNGVGIEGYDEKDVRCRNLKKVINFDCMKVITTRDDVDTLQNHYVTNPDIETARVGDPALWTPECYGISRAGKPRVTGINIIRSKVFTDYGNKSSGNVIKEFYKELLTEMDRRGLPWELFSNGMGADQRFGEIVLKSLHIKQQEKLQPAPKTSQEFLDHIRSYNCVFGARLHACITSYSLGVPVVGFIWNEKTRIFAKVIGKEENFFEENALDVKAIVDRIEAEIGGSYDTDIREELKGLTKQYLSGFLKTYVQ